MLQTIQEASFKQWQAAAWVLERRFPDRWRKQEQPEIKDSIEPKKPTIKDLPLDFLKLNDEEYEQFKFLYRKIWIVDPEKK